LKIINLWFEGMLIVDANVRKSLLCGEEQIDVTKDKKYIGRLDMATHRLIYKRGLTGLNYRVERRS